MTENIGNKIKLADNNFVTARREIEVPNGAEKLKLYVREIGYMELQSLAPTGQNIFTHMIALAVSDKHGNQFTFDEVQRLKKEVSEPLLKAVIEVNHLSNEESVGGPKN